MKSETNKICGHVVVVMAPTGSGKGVIIQHALQKYPDLYQTVSCTSRTRRPSEITGKHYHFVTIEEFNKKTAAGDFLEWAEFAGNKYGTLKSEILPRLSNCGIVIVEIELQGVEQLLELLPREHLTIVYIEAGDWEVLRSRASKRSPMSETELSARHERFLIEQQAKPLADVIIDNTADIEIAHTEFDQVVEDAYSKCKL
ncbi:MAG: guanylate kinase [Candidatus Paceibacteria bacterium]|jgi:guanylate kinase